MYSIELDGLGLRCPLLKNQVFPPRLLLIPFTDKSSMTVVISHGFVALGLSLGKKNLHNSSVSETNCCYGRVNVAAGLTANEF